MIATVFMIHLRRLLHSRVELMLTFVVPVAFFSVFAIIFAGGVGGGTTPKIKVAIVDEVDDLTSRQLVEQLRQNESLRLMRDEPPRSIRRSDAADWVRSGSLTMAIVIGKTPTRSPGALANIHVDLLSDSSDQVASQVVSAMVSQCLGRLRGETFNVPKPTDPALANSTLAGPRSADSLIDNGQRFAMRTGADSAINLPVPRPGDRVATPRSNQPAITPAIAAAFDPAAMIDVVDVIGENKSNPVISMYAAGIAVMFLLFGASGGGGTLLEEKENQTLDRLLSTQMTMDQLLLGKWTYLTILGLVQVTVMFLWAQFVFGVNLFGHLDGFLMMTIVTSSAAASLGLFLATLCRTRGQLNGLSVILILTMSALGGSMVPRYVMSDSLREAGLWTFNAWALDGYDKVFWRELPVEALAPQMTVLMLSGVGLLVAARVLAIRWETE